jgi:hypothetical protein
MTGRSRRRLRQQDDLAENVALLEPPVGVLDPVQRERRLDGQLQLSGRDQPGEFSEHARAGPLRVALGLDPVPCDGLEVDDGVDAGRLDAVCGMSTWALTVEDLLPQDVCVPAVLGEFAQYVEVHPAQRERAAPVAVDPVVQPQG